MGFARDRMGKLLTDTEALQLMQHPPEAVVEWPGFTGKTFLGYESRLSIIRCRGAAGGDTPMEIEEAWRYDSPTQYRIEWSEIVLLPMSVALKRPT